MFSDEEHLSTTGHADFIFEVEPDPRIFDTVRRAIVDELEAEYSDVLAVNIREHIHVDVVDIDPADWVVTGRLNGDIPDTFDFEVRVPPKTDTTGDVIEFLRDAIDDRYGPNVDADVVVFEKIGMRPRAWFVDAKVPPSVDTDG
jgi:hypothetical protein